MGPILDMMAVVLESILTANTVVARSTISSVNCTTQILLLLSSVNIGKFTMFNIVKSLRGKNMKLIILKPYFCSWRYCFVSYMLAMEALFPYTSLLFTG